MNLTVVNRLLGKVLLAVSTVAVLSSCEELGISNPIQQQPSGTFQAGQVVGGATKQMAVGAPVGAFLPQPGLLVSGRAGQPDWVYINSSVNVSSYSKILLDPVSIWAGSNSALNSVPADQQEA